MCKKAVCSNCQKATWWGCGSHIPMVMDSIPEAERCPCEPKKEVGGKQYPPMGPAFGMVKAAFGMGGGSGSGSAKEEL